MKFNFARTKLGVAALAAFSGGLIVAGGFDLTPFSHAQTRSTASAPIIPAARSVADLSNAFVAIAEQVTPSVVSIQAESPSLARPRARTQPQQPQQQQQNPRQQQQNPRQGIPPGVLPPGFEDFFEGPNFGQPAEPAVASGTGFIVSRDGYVLTNNHVVTRNDRTTRQERVTVTLNDGRPFVAKIIGNDPETDVAVLKIDANNLPAVVMGDDNATRIGEWVVAIGNPLGLDFTVTAGIVSAKGRNATAGRNAPQYRISDFIQTDAAINPGNSGGPLLNVRGEVVGINSMIASTTGYYSGYGFAIPITLAKSIMDNLIANGRIRASILGVSIDELSPEDADAAGLKNLQGVLVRGYPGDSVNSPAYKAGIRLGDVILAVNDKEIDRVGTLQRTIRSFPPSSTVDVKVMRYGEPRTIKVRLEERVETASATSAASGTDRAPAAPTFAKLGITTEVVTPQWLQQNRVTGSVEGLIVTDVESGRRSAQRLRGAIITDVSRPGQAFTPVKTEADLHAALSRFRDGDVMVARVRSLTEGPGGTGVVSAPIVINVRIGPE